MDLRQSLFIMISGSFIIQFVIMSALMTNKPLNIRSSVGKFYISVIMALLMGLLEVAMYDYHMSSISIFYYLFLGLILAIFVYLYRTQSYMIEHHSMALLTSEEILEKTSSERVKRLAENIISTQQAEIEYMSRLLNTI